MYTYTTCICVFMHPSCPLSTGKYLKSTISCTMTPDSDPPLTSWLTYSPFWQRAKFMVPLTLANCPDAETAEQS